jgi:hypothetical protein
MKKITSALLVVMLLIISISCLGLYGCADDGETSNGDEQVKEILIYDSENDYYYVEMGEYNDSAIQWKYVGYVADDGTYTRSTTPVKGKQGIFILQTYIDNAMKFYSEQTAHEDGAPATDYAESDMRAYLTETMVTTFKLSDSEIYSQIVGRSLEDLYSNISDDGTALTPYSNAQEVSGGDKLWLMTETEACNVLCGGNWDWDAKDLIWGPEGSWVCTRTFYDDQQTISINYYDGSCQNWPIYYDQLVRCAFLLSI